jgi:hypothetical protein
MGQDNRTDQGGRQMGGGSQGTNQPGSGTGNPKQHEQQGDRSKQPGQGTPGQTGGSNTTRPGQDKPGQR